MPKTYTVECSNKYEAYSVKVRWDNFKIIPFKLFRNVENLGKFYLAE